MIVEKYLCDEDCNNCPLIGHPNSRQLTLVLNALHERFGDGVYEIVQSLCPNMTVCFDCRIDDFVHFEGCKILDAAKKVAEGASLASRLASRLSSRRIPEARRPKKPEPPKPKDPLDAPATKGDLYSLACALARDHVIRPATKDSFLIWLKGESNA